MPIISDLLARVNGYQPIGGAGTSFLSGGLNRVGNFLSRLNPFRGINFEQDVLGRYGPAFVPRGENLDRPSYFAEARDNIGLQSLGQLGSRYRPVAGWLTRGIASGLFGGVRSANPYIGIATGVGTLATTIGDLYKEQRSYNQAKLEQERVQTEIDRNNNIINTLKKIDSFVDYYTSYHQNKQKAKQNELQIERVNNGIEEAKLANDPVKRFNDLKVENAVNITINGDNTRARQSQIIHRSQANRYRPNYGLNNFFTTIGN